MADPATPLGLLLAAPPGTSQLQAILWKGPTDVDVGQHAVSDIQDVDTAGVDPSGPDDWEDAIVDDLGNVSRRSKTLTFTCTGSNPGCQALGYYVVAMDGAVPQLIDISRFDEPRAMAAPGDQVKVVVNASVMVRPS